MSCIVIFSFKTDWLIHLFFVTWGRAVNFEDPELENNRMGMFFFQTAIEITFFLIIN